MGDVLIDITGQVFGQWTVIKRAPNVGRKAYWLCRCSCGRERPVFGTRLRIGGSSKCRNCSASKPRRKRPVEERFWLYVKKGKKNECWPWTGYADKDGYGWIKISKKMVRANRFSYELHKGPIPEGLGICHSCDNPPCCNPAHLWPGTALDNEKDKWAKGRGLRGDQSPRAVMTAARVKRLRQQREKTGATYDELATIFHIDRTTVAQIVRRKTWTHV